MTRADDSRSEPASKAAPLWRRLAAAFYDWMIVFACLFLATAALLPLTGGEPVPSTLGYRAYLLVVVVLYFAGHWRWLGRTPGMRAWRLRVETPAGARPDWPAALRRFAAAVLSAVPLLAGFFAQLPDLEQRTWHDRLSDTRLRFYPKRRKR